MPGQSVVHFAVQSCSRAKCLQLFGHQSNLPWQNHHPQPPSTVPARKRTHPPLKHAELNIGDIWGSIDKGLTMFPPPPPPPHTHTHTSPFSTVYTGQAWPCTQNTHGSPWLPQMLSSSVHWTVMLINDTFTSALWSERSLVSHIHEEAFDGSWRKRIDKKYNLKAKCVHTVTSRVFAMFRTIIIYDASEVPLKIYKG